MISNMSSEMINRTIGSIAKNFPGRVGQIEYNNSIGMITKVHSDFSVDVYIPAMGTILNNVSVEQTGGEHIGDIISPSVSSFCKMSRVDGRWVAKPGIDFRKGKKVRDLFEGEMERYTKNTSIKQDLTGSIHLDSKNGFLRVSDTLDINSESIRIRNRNIDLFIGTISVDGDTYPYTRLITYKERLEENPTSEESFSQAMDAIVGIAEMTNYILEAKNTVNTDSFDDNLSKLKKFRSEIYKSREISTVSEYGIALRDRFLSSSSFKRISNKDIIVDRKRNFCISRKRIYKDNVIISDDKKFI